MKKYLLIAGAVILGLVLLIQIIPVNRSNPPVTQEIKWDSEATKQLAQRACYDCHSNETVWPWYAYIAPISWRVTDHVEHGRSHVNFSEWDKPQHEADELVEVVEEGEMPLWDYLLMHPEADLSPVEVEALITGMEQTLTADPPAEEESHEHGEGDEHGEDDH